MADMAKLNYATEYQQALEQAFPYVLYFGALFAAPNNGRFRWVNSRTIEIPTISTTGRVDGDRDTIGTKKRNYQNAWTPLTLSNHRQWNTLVHPRDIAETGNVTTISNITRVYNQEQKFPEMNAYLVSKAYDDFIRMGRTPRTDVLTVETVLEVFDAMMERMDEKRVPRQGRILYVTPAVKTLINNAKQLYRTFDVKTTSDRIRRGIAAIDEVEIPASVPSDMMKTLYDFTEGWAVDADAQQINMVLVHPTAVITPITYEFAQLDAPSAGSDGKYVYFEESFEDVFLLPHKKDAIDFCVSNDLGGMVVDTNIAPDFDLLGKVLSDLQSGITIDGDAISGTLNKVTGYTGFSGTVSEQSGHYLALRCDVPDVDGCTITVEVIGGTHGPVALDSDRTVVLRIASNNQKVRFTASKTDWVSFSRTFTLSGLTLAE